ncbi:hypothetical protein G6F68_011887 [Rhizopus microsporus]|nr:hypothetical protein G6F68_011887 [Rhizopus microsporus]
MAQRMPVKRRAKNGATRSTMWCWGSNHAMNASGWPGTSRKRTNALILCVSRRTAWASAIALSTSASAGLGSTARAAARYGTGRWRPGRGIRAGRWERLHLPAPLPAAPAAHPAATLRCLRASPAARATRRAATHHARRRARPAVTRPGPPAATSAARQAAGGASNSDPWRGGGASCARSAAGSSSALRG